MCGNMKVSFLPLGKISVLYDDLIRPKDGREKTPQTVEIPTWAIYIEHPDAKLIFDTGQKHLPDGSLSRDELVRQLALCKTAPEEIDYVIMSHLHNDHAGNMGLFQNAQIIVQRQELSDALVESHVEAPYGIYHREDVDANVSWKLVEGRHQLLNGIELIPFPGHTRGLQGMMLTLKNTGKMIITSDACYGRENYGPPVRLSSVAVDDKLSVDSMEAIRRIAEENHARVIFGHDLQQFETLKKAPDFYD